MPPASVRGPAVASMSIEPVGSVPSTASMYVSIEVPSVTF
jgi:hypothetical protein